MIRFFFSRLVLASLPVILIALIGPGPRACAESPPLASAPAETLTLAVATNFYPVAQSLVAAYQNLSPQTGRLAPGDDPARIDIVTGSSGQLLAQIKNGAPFDVFLSADRKRAEAAEHMGFGVAGMRFTYATGRLALWSRDARNLPLSSEVGSFKTALAKRRIALANPALAPYGRAAIEVLDHLNLDPARLDLAYGENISHAFSFAATGQTDLTLTSLSFAQHYADISSDNNTKQANRRAAYKLVPSSWHDPIHQQAVFLNRASLNLSATAFWDFLQGDIARDIIAQAGYDSAINARSSDLAVIRDRAFGPGLATTRDDNATSKPLVENAPRRASEAKGWFHGLGPLWLSFKLAAATTLILLILGTPLAWWLATSASPLRPMVEAATALPLVLPPTVLGFYLLVLFNPDAPLGAGWVAVTGTQLTFSFVGLVIASVLYSLPFMVQPLQASFQNIGQAPWEAAASLGARPIDRFFTIMLPLARRGLITGSILSFTHTIGEFGVILMVGGNIPGQTRVISIAIFEHVETLNYGEATRLAVILLLFSFVTLLWVYSTNKRAIIHGR